jgi:hypothetical protein
MVMALLGRPAYGKRSTSVGPNLPSLRDQVDDFKFREVR